VAIADKTRKLLWGRSGNRCAVCRQELLVDATPADLDSVVGDECHIVSGKRQGPRYDPVFPFQSLHETYNFILLCRVHHKMVDDQPQTYTVERLRKLKADHEAWVASKLSPEHAANQPRARLRRVKAEIPEYLLRLTSGAEVFKIMQGACGFSFDHDEPESEKETELVASFLQEAQDWGDLSGDLEAGEQVRAAFRISTLVDELERAGFWIFGARETQRLEVGLGPPSAWPVAILEIHRSTSVGIIRVGLDKKQSPT
jgi:hypothetical protein